MVKLKAATVDGVAMAQIKIPENGYVIGGGTGYFASGTNGDWLDICVVDVDNILGYGAGTVVKCFSDNGVPAANKGYYIDPNQELKIDTIVSDDPAALVKDLWLRLIATKNDVADSDTFYANLRWGKRLR